MDDDSGMRLVHRLRAITVELGLAGDEFARLHGLHATDLRALIHLLDAGRAGIAPTPGWLGAQLGLNSASVTALADRLERLGHIRRVRDTADRRRVLLEVDERAAALGWSFFGPLIERTVEATRSYTAAELATIERFLGEVANAITTTRAGR